MRELGFELKEKEIHNMILFLDDDGSGNIRCDEFLKRITQKFLNRGRQMASTFECSR